MTIQVLALVCVFLCVSIDIKLCLIFMGHFERTRLLIMLVMGFQLLVLWYVAPLGTVVFGLLIMAIPSYLAARIYHKAPPN